MNVYGMKRFAIVGSGGSGKTWLANRLGDALGIDVVHLDSMYYVGEQTRDYRDFTRMQESVTEGERWIIEGNYVSSLPTRLARAEVVILVDVHPLICAWSVLSRQLSRPQSGARNVLSIRFLWYVLRFRAQMRPRVLEQVSRGLTDRDDLVFIRLRGRRQSRGFARRARRAL